MSPTTQNLSMVGFHLYEICQNDSNLQQKFFVADKFLIITKRSFHNHKLINMSFSM